SPMHGLTADGEIFVRDVRSAGLVGVSESRIIRQPRERLARFGPPRSARPPAADAVDVARNSIVVERLPVLARRFTKLRAKYAAEMSCVVEAPPKKNIRYGQMRVQGVDQVSTALLEPPRSHVVSEGVADPLK